MVDSIRARLCTHGLRKSYEDGRVAVEYAPYGKTASVPTGELT
jgi:hypothetical protein